MKVNRMWRGLERLPKSGDDRRHSPSERIESPAEIVSSRPRKVDIEAR